MGAYRLVRALVDPFALWDRDQPMVEVIYQKRFLARGPRIVAIGGGTGLSTLLRGLKEHTSNLTAVVTVADDGGSSGVLRAELGIPAVGDIRNCVVALADAEPLMGRLLQYRFPGDGPASRAGKAPADDGTLEGAAPPAGLGGHAVGNLLLAALVEVQHGDFEEGVREMNRVLAVRGRVVPATGTAITLHARLDDGTEVEGQSLIARTQPRGPGLGGAARASDPPTTPSPPSPRRSSSSSGPAACSPACSRRCWCPGSGRRSRRPGALVVFACNVATQPGETGGYRPRGPPRRPRAARRRPPAGRRPGEQPLQRAGPGRLGGGAGPAALAAGRDARARGSSWTISWTPPTPTITPRTAWRPRSCAAWEREGGRRRRPGSSRVERSA